MLTALEIKAMGNQSVLLGDLFALGKEVAALYNVRRLKDSQVILSATPRTSFSLPDVTRSRLLSCR